MGQLKNRAGIFGGSTPQVSTRIDARMFFDRPGALRAMDKRTRQMLGRAGAITRRTARKSMKTAPATRHAPAGHAPFKHTKTRQNPSGGGLHRSVMYGYDSGRQAAVVGPSTVLGANIANVASNLEHGGVVSRRNPRRTKRQVGKSGEIHVAYSGTGARRRNSAGRYRAANLGGRSGNTKPTKVRRNGRNRTAYVTYAKLRSPAMAARANRLNEELYGPETIGGVVEPRPFMLPAMAEVAPIMPRLYRTAG